MDIGTVAILLGVSYALGVLWYGLLRGKLAEQVWRVAAYPFLGIFVAEMLLPPILTFDPIFGGIHLVTAFVGSFAAVVADWIITQARHPALIAQPEPLERRHAA
jgi:hypothetical protein